MRPDAQIRVMVLFLLLIAALAGTMLLTSCGDEYESQDRSGFNCPYLAEDSNPENDCDE